MKSFLILCSSYTITQIALAIARNDAMWSILVTRFQLWIISVADPSNLIEYQLSNEHFVKLGWTLLPITKTMRKIIQYEARPAKPSLDW